MNEKRTGRTSVKQSSDWKRVATIDDRQIRKGIENDPDARATDIEFWKTARVVVPQAKQTITIRLDADLLEWLRKGKGYQTRINAVLRTYMDASMARRRR
ncbi:MAG: BrnA antitoxin family protein [Candidatus Solibacter usitatus]|nr:BrnA antitoxin family protein [Candidatus Solibacter usitatus]